MNKLRQELSLTFDDVLIEPTLSKIRSRNDVDVRQYFEFGDKSLQLDTPIIASCMDTVSEVEMAIKMAELGGMAILHRFIDADTQAKWIEMTRPHLVGAAVGAGLEDKTRVRMLADAGCEVICVDVANGQTQYSADMVAWIKSEYDDMLVIAGNVATGEGFLWLEQAGADMVRVGIGGGSFCTTRTTTGIGVAQLSAIMDCADVAWNAVLIADGGVRNAGDLCKAFAAGADIVMIGGLLVGTDESPGEVYEASDGALFKQGRGMASLDAQKARYTDGRDFARVVPEGISSNVPYVGSTESVINRLIGGLRSSMTYVNASNLEEYFLNTRFVQITNAGLTESHPHILHY